MSETTTTDGSGDARERVATVDWAPWAYGEAGVELDDPAESFHEASKLAPTTVDHRAPGGRLLLASEQMRITAARAVKRHRQARKVPLPPTRFPAVDFSAVVRHRQSRRDFGSRCLTLEELSAVLGAAYGVTHEFEEAGQPLRSVPSGGGLYPLELYPVVCRVEGLRPGVYHFDPLRRALEVLREEDVQAELETLTVYPELLVPSSVVVLVTAMFWRTRFKYGLRGYRFALLEAGHVGQNALLAATALDLAAVPVGGFYDRLVDRFLGVDGVNESAVYAFSMGSRSEE